LERVVTFEDSPTKAGVESMAAFLQRGADVSSSRLLDARAACDPRDACMIVYTSGSTGMPKGALLHHEGICTFSRTQNALWPVKPLRILNYFPINHIGCTIDVTLPCLAAGGTVIFMEQFDAAASLELMQKERVTVWASVPSGFAMQLALPEFSRADFSAVQLILWEGAQMPVQMLRTLRGIGPRLATNYGMTETTSAITALAPTDDEEILANTVGSAFPGVEMRLVDPQGREVPEGTEGEVLTRSAQNMLGYWRNPEATRASFTDDGFFRTGDLAIRREDGRYRLVGRLKEMFKSGGYNVYPREIETVLEEHPAVALAAVVPASDPLWQEVGVAFVVPKSAIRAEQLQDWCSARLANYKVPKRFELRKSLPLLPIGKVDKVALREITDSSSASSTTPRR
jgi:acyl-CoA synthetase (AMP-forming)/AMP-acid ligase II